MKPEFTEDGISVQTYEEIYEELSDGYKNIYGSDIDLSANTPDGQRIGIEAQARLDLQTFGLQVYNQLDPDFALGQALNKIIKLSGISRRPAIRSQIDVTITTDRALTLSSGYTVQDTIGQNWVTTSDSVLASGANTVTLFSENFGAYEASIGTVITPITIVIGIISVTNATAATVGQDEETDEELRIRRNNSLLAPATSSIGALYTAIGDINGVTDVKVYENDTDTTDVTLNLAAHSIWCIIEGGDVTDIGEILAKTKNAGTGIKGSVDATYTEEITLPDGSTFYYIHEMVFDRPTDQDVYIQMTLTRKITTDPIDLDLVKQNLAALTFRIGESLQAGDLYSTVYDSGNNFIATDLQISLDDITYTDGNIDPDPDGRFIIDEANIDITEVV